MDEYILLMRGECCAVGLASDLIASPAQRPTGAVPEGQRQKWRRTLSRAFSLRKSNVDNPTANILSLCSGVGMLDLGVEIALEHIGRRPRTVGYVERDSFAASVLLARMEDQSLEPAPIWCGNLEQFDWLAYQGLVDVLTAGFPCQPHSVAGKRAGTDDERWIWPRIVDGLRILRPRFVFLENVSGLRSSGGFPIVLQDLATLGFAVEWDSVRASDVGASHQRERVFLLAYRPSERRRKARPDSCQSEIGVSSGCTVLANTNRKQCDFRGHVAPEVGDWEHSSASRELPLFAPGPDDHQWHDIVTRFPHLAPATESAVHGLANGLADLVDLSRSDQIRCAGNGVVPLQTAVAFVVLARRAGVVL